MSRTQVGQWAGNAARGAGANWPGAPKMAAANRKEIDQSLSWRHEQITKGLYATKVPGLEGVKSTNLMLGHAVNPTGRPIRPTEKWKQRRAESSMF